MPEGKSQIMRLSHRQIMRKLSVQPEESGFEDDDDGLQLHSSSVGRAALPSLDDDTPFMTIGPNTEHDMELDFIELRKLSTASMSSSKSTSSLSSTCSAPGTMSCSPKKLESSAMMQPISSKKTMTSRPSFVSLCSIVSETAEEPVWSEFHRRLPPALQVELDLMQRSGLEGDEPKCRSLLPIFRCPSDYDINTMKTYKEGEARNTKTLKRSTSVGILNGIKHIPDKFRNLSTEKRRFNVYSISNETREQLKHLYVY